MLTFYEFAVINARLRSISDTWSDLWGCLYYLPVGVGRIIRLQYSDLSGEWLTFKQRGRLKEVRVLGKVRISHQTQKNAYVSD